MVLVALLTPPAQVMTEAGTLVLGEMVSVLRSGLAIEAEAVDLQFSEKGLRIKFIFPETDRWAEWDEQWPVECIKGPEVTLLHRLPLNPHSASQFRGAQIKKARAKSKSKGQVVQLVTDTLRECFLKQGVDLGQAFRFFGTTNNQLYHADFIPTTTTETDELLIVPCLLACYLYVSI